MVGFKGSRKRTNLAAEKTVQAILQDAERFGIVTADLIIKGVGYNRSAALQSFDNRKISISSIADRTAIAHGGCRPRKSKK
jgi:small subunit ribosomal protein S11